MRRPNFRYVGFRSTAIGRVLGDVVYAAAAPGGEFSPCDGTEANTATHPGILNTKLWTVRTLNRNDASALTFYTSACDGTTIFMNQNGDLAIYQKTAGLTGPSLIGNMGSALGGVNYIRACANGFVFADKRNGAGTQYASFASTPYTSWTDVAIGANPLQDVLWTGTRYIFASVGLNWATTPGGSRTAGTGTSISTTTFYRLTKIGSVIWAQGASGVWAKSTNDGVAWTLTTGVGNSPLAGESIHPTTYCPNLGRWFGMCSTGDLVSTAGNDPTTTWTTERTMSSAFTPSTTSIIELSFGILVILGNQGIAVRFADGTYDVPEDGTNAWAVNPLYPPWMYEIGGYLCVNSLGYRNKILSLPQSAVSVPIIANFRGLHAYMKIA